jgi:hypothetical protein
MPATAGPKPKSYTLQAGEKATPIMVYTENSMIWGDVINKEALRINTWLRTPSAPQYVAIHDAQVLTMAGGGPPKPQSIRELFVPALLVDAFHLMPPAQEPLDYEPNEPNRKMVPVIALAGLFRFDAYVRMSTQTSLERFLDVMKESFTSLYEVEVSSPALPGMSALKVPFMIIRREKVLFSPGPAAS